jgi:hypothetical protein
VFVIVMRGKPYPMSIIIVSKKLQHWNSFDKISLLLIQHWFQLSVPDGMFYLICP